MARTETDTLILQATGLLTLLEAEGHVTPQAARDMHKLFRGHASLNLMDSDEVSEADELRGLITQLVDTHPCEYDHNGGCQAHGYLSLKPGETCPMWQAQQIAAEVKQ